MFRKDMSKKCSYHRTERHATGDCLQLKDILKKLARQGDLTQFINEDFYKQHSAKYNGKEYQFRKKIPLKREYANERHREFRHREDDRQPDRRQDRLDRQTSHVINVISGDVASGGDTNRERRSYLRDQHGSVVMHVETSSKRPRENETISFSEKDQGDIKGPHDDALVLSLKVGVFRVKKVLIDTGSSADILYLKVYQQMGHNPKHLRKTQTPLIGFTGNTLQPEGIAHMRVDFRTPPLIRLTMVDFLVVDAPSAYNAIIGRGTLNVIGAVISTSHLKMKFHIEKGIGEECGHQQMARDCYLLSLKGKGSEVHKVEKPKQKNSSKKPQLLPDIEPHQEVVLDPKDQTEETMPLEPTEEIEEIEVGEGRMLNIGKAIQGQARKELVGFL